ncbi:hypothetical protein OG884_05620 [Streptosporangium sp. NBC_01755]|uniref:hypothetical protein n=1 Tax=Streptosporangium sp. NBC_01755 TaxID=2975949 RepID=UPI002DDB3EB3|nr:hypothetical protein [Streptosporangium sp. NBC_01755]WSD01403.1 hypothetical protein OG884_05620 [Streptosporangium sp. NBC_01755]
MKHDTQPAPAPAPVESSAVLDALRDMCRAAVHTFRAGRWVWRRLVCPHRDQLAPVGLALSALTIGSAGHITGAPWWATAAVFAAGIAGVRIQLDRRGVQPEHRDALAGATATWGVWATAATVFGPTIHVQRAWLVWTLIAAGTWLLNPTSKAWRRLRARVRNWSRQLPAVLAGLGMSGVTVTSISMQAGGRVLFHLRLPLNVTESLLAGEREKIWSGMGWPKDSIEIRQDPDHNAADRVVLAYQDRRAIVRRDVVWDPDKASGAILNAQWWGVDEDGHDVFVPVYLPGVGMTRGLYQGAPGSAKSNHLRMIAANGAPCLSTLYLVIDLKSRAASLRGFLPRTAWLATTEAEATLLLEAAAEIIRRRGALLKPEHNGVLPPTPEHPAIIILVDEFAPIWGKRVRDRRAVDAALLIAQQGRALGVGMEGAAQYLSENAIRTDLRALFDSHNACYRVRKKEDAQFTLADWRHVNATQLPIGSSYLTLAGEEYPRRLDAPEVTEAILTQSAKDHEEIAPDLEASTAEGLPGWSDRWGRLPVDVLPYCSPTQRRMAEAARDVQPLRVAAAGSPRRLVVSERIDEPQGSSAQGSATQGTAAALAAMCAVLTARGEARTHELLAAAKGRGKGRSWAMDRLPTWVGAGLVTSPSRGVYRLSCTPEALLEGVREAERVLTARRRGDGS